MNMDFITKLPDYEQVQAQYPLKEADQQAVSKRNKEIAEDISLAGFIYRADKKSRPCYFCEAESECDWSVTKKNLEIC